MSHEPFDVVVVGGGPAGSIAARALARLGRTVLLVDRDAHPRWKVCGGCLSGRGVAALAAEGLADLVRSVGGTSPSSLELQHRGRRMRVPLDGTLVISRASLDLALLEAACAAGAQTRTGWSATLGPLESAAEADETRTVELRQGDRRTWVAARLVIGATGLAPIPAAGTADAPTVRTPELGRIGAGAILPRNAFGDDTPGAETIRMIVGRTGYLGIGTLGDGRLDVAAALDPTSLREGGGVAAAISRLLDEAGHGGIVAAPEEGWRGTPRLTRAAVRPGARRLLLVGDAASYVEPFTGEGMTWALEDGRAVVEHADALLRGADPDVVLEAWERDRARRAATSRFLARAAAWLTRHPTRARAAFGVLAALPSLARPLVRAATAAPGRAHLTPEQDPA